MELAVHGVVRSPAEVDERGVEFVRHDGIAALATSIGAGSRLRREDVLRHSELLQRVAGRTTVLPLRFGTVFPSEDAVVADFLRPHRAELTVLLDRLDGKVELMLKARLREGRVMPDVLARDERIARLRERTRTLPEAASYFERIRLGELVADALAGERAACAQWLLGRLEPLALEAAVVTETPDPYAVRTSFLVARDEVEAFDAAVETLAREAADTLECKLVGPLAPYAFVERSFGAVEE